MVLSWYCHGVIMVYLISPASVCSLLGPREVPAVSVSEMMSQLTVLLWPNAQEHHHDNHHHHHCNQDENAHDHTHHYPGNLTTIEKACGERGDWGGAWLGYVHSSVSLPDLPVLGLGASVGTTRMWGKGH